MNGAQEATGADLAGEHGGAGTGRLADTLEAIPAAYAQLAHFRLSGSAPVDPDKRSGKSNPAWRSELNIAVLDLLDEREKADAESTRLDYDIDRRAGARRQGVLPTLASWTRLVDGELWDMGVEHDPPADEPTVQTECDFLLSHVNWVDDQQWADEIVEDCTAILRDIRHAIGWKPEATELTYRCTKCGWNVIFMDDDAWAKCSGCDKTWTFANEINHLLADQGSSLTLRQCAEAVGRSKTTLEQWRARGLINPVARDKQGRFLFDSRIVERVSEQTKRRERDRVA